MNYRQQYRQKPLQIPADHIRADTCDTRRCTFRKTHTATVQHLRGRRRLHTTPTTNYSLLTANSPSYTFSAKEKDSETGLSYFGSRYYSSDLSVWLSVDPMASKYPSLSPYVYCANNPVRVVDPDGEEIVITETTDKNGNKVVNISFTAILVNKTSTDISDGDMAKYKNDIITGLEKTYNGKKDDGTIVNIDVDITIQPNDELVTPFTTRHTINIVDKLEDMDHSAESLIGGGTMDIRLDVCKGYYPDKPSGRSAAHEFGHLLGLKHNQEADNIMNPNGRGRVITGAQIQEASKNYQKGIINNFLGITVRDDHRRQSRKAHK